MQATQTTAPSKLIKTLLIKQLKRSRSVLLGIAIGFGIAGAGAPTLADEVDEVGKLISQGQYDQALSRADAFLANRPNDAQMRFMKGIVLTERNRTAEAIVIFTKLTEDYPELPEPYNNLAVLHAGRGEYEKARSALEMAIRTHPSYATAHENLGDVYAKLASQSYDKALQLDGRNSTAQTKLALVRNLIGGKSSGNETPNKNRSNTNTSTQAPTPATPPANATNSTFNVASAPISNTSANSTSSTPPSPISSSKATVKTTPPTPPVAEKPVAPPPAPPEPKRTTNLPPISAGNTSAPNTPSTPQSPAIQTTPGAKPAAISTAPAEKSTPSAGNTIGVDSQVLQAVERWAKAWSDQNMKVYLDSYSKDFNPPGNMSRASWEKMRQQRIVGRENIRVAVDNPLITITGNQAVVKFKQNYFSDRLNNVSQKVLDMKLENGQWRIVSERVGG